MVNGMDMDLFEVFIFELYNIFLVLLDVNGLFREVYVLNFVVLKNCYLDNILFSILSMYLMVGYFCVGFFG